MHVKGLRTSTKNHGVGHPRRDSLMVIAFSKPFDIDCMRGAIDEVVQRHGATSVLPFSLSKRRETQTEYLSRLGIRGRGRGSKFWRPTRGEKAYEISLAAHRKPNFLLDRLPLLMFTIFDLGEGEWGFNLIFHHMYLFISFVTVFNSDGI